jgi:hypothetical protein
MRQVRNILLLIFLFCCCIAERGVAQEKTIGGNRLMHNTAMDGAPSLLVVGCEAKMYRSDVDREIGKANTMTHEEISRFFRSALAASLHQTFASRYNTISGDDRSTGYSSKDGGLSNFMHENVRYVYEVLKVEDTTSSKLKQLVKRKPREPKSKSGIVEGQVAVQPSQNERYMHAVLENDTLLSFLKKSEQVDYVLFINELDVTYFIKDPAKAAYGGVEKSFKVHYTIYSTDGKVILSGAEKAYVDGSESNIHQLANSAFTKTATAILESFGTAISSEKG